MNILFIVPYTPTPIRTRPYNLLRGLAQRGHTLALATLYQNPEEQAALREWQELGVRVVAAPLPLSRSLASVLRALPGPAPLQASFCWQPALAQQIAAELASQPYDIVHVEHLRGARYGLALTTPLANPESPLAYPAACPGTWQSRGQAIPNRESPIANRQSPIPLVWDSVDSISHLFEQTAHTSVSPASRLLARIDLARTRRYEAWLPQRFDRVLVTSAVDKSAFERLSAATSARANVVVLANGVDLAYFQPDAGLRRVNDIVFSGKMSYHANVTAVMFFANQVLPLVWASRPQTTFTIAGHHPPAQIRALARDTRITVTGSVSDLRPYLRRAALAIAPMPYGAGIQNKVLEALACATPVVATPQAVSALAMYAGEHVLVAEGAGELAAAVLRLLGDDALRRRLGRAGRQYVEEHHDWADIVARLEAVYRDAIVTRRSR